MLKKGLTIEKLVVGQLQTNCFLIIDDKTKSCLIVDPGDDADYISQVISRKSICPISIILTHGHFDHLLAVGELKAIYDIPLSLSKKDEFLLRDYKKRASFWLKMKAGLLDPAINRDLKDGKRVKIGQFNLEIIAVPGHTPGSIALYQKENSMVFVGDLIFSDASVGRADYSYSNQKALKESVKKILKLPLKTIVYSGHGKETKIGYLRSQVFKKFGS